MKRYAALILLALPLLACGSGNFSFGATPTPDPCSPELIEITLEPIFDLDGRFADAFNIALSTPRMSLATPIANMQEIRRDAEELVIHECVEPIQEQQIAYMDMGIETMLAFMANNETDAEIDERFKDMEQARMDFLEALLSTAGELTPESTP